MTTPRVFIIILQYNNSQDTIWCLNSVKELDYPVFETVVIDNGSHQEHLNNIKNFIIGQAGMKLLENKENLGYGGGNNTGINYALKNKADYVFILNNDAVILPDMLKKLVPPMESSENIGILGPAIREEGRIVWGGAVKWLKPQLKHREKIPKQSKIYIPGAAMLIRKEVFKKIGLLDERYFLYFEDADYSVKAKKAGYKLAIIPETVITHKVSSSAKKLGSPLILRYHIRNSLMFNSLRAPIAYRFFVPLWSLHIMAKQLIKLAFRINVQESKEILEGVLDFYKGKTGKI